MKLYAADNAMDALILFLTDKFYEHDESVLRCGMNILLDDNPLSFGNVYASKYYNPSIYFRIIPHENGYLVGYIRNVVCLKIYYYHLFHSRTWLR